MKTEIVYSKNLPNELSDKISDELIYLENMPPLENAAVFRQIKISLISQRVARRPNIGTGVCFNVLDFNREGNYLKSTIYSEKDLINYTA